ncbi:hypothetical protein ACPB9J_16080 [Streptomyces lavendulocolor]|uniref:hypothetical protein n=1 Tax=Streptomyces lavendulocolor TaxID=67316 RepID=UPI003C2D96E2
MDTTEPVITPETARHVLFMFGRPGGQQPGRFTQHLMAAIECADLVNASLLVEVYPELVAAVRLAKYHDGGIDQLKAIASGKAAA